MASASSPSSAGSEGSSETLPRVVLVYGPGPGLGKSTLGRALTGGLISQGVPARLVEEHEITAYPAFRGYVQGVEAGRADDTATLIEACRRFVSELDGRGPEIAMLDVALSRAVEDRGMDWALGLAATRAGRRDLDALLSYFRRLREGSERMLALWPHRVVRVDTVGQGLRSCVDGAEAILRATGTGKRMRGGT